MSRPIVKICGVTSEDEVEHLARLGVDFFGLVVDVASPWTIDAARAQALAERGANRLRPTLITRPADPQELERLVRQVGARAIQLSPLTPPEHVRRLREAFDGASLLILQEVRYGGGRFRNEERIDAYLSAGADYILVDKSDRSTIQNGAQATIPEAELSALRARHPQAPLLVAGGISPDNVRGLLNASGAAGIDVCSSVRGPAGIEGPRVARLLEQLPKEVASMVPRPQGRIPSLRALLESVGHGNQVIAYLTLGDPPGRFLEVADEVLAAGALTLELGFPHAQPSEGPVLTASHQRALQAGTDTPRALAMFKTLASRHPNTPLVAVLQAPMLTPEDQAGRLLDELVAAGAAAVLPVGLAPWQLPGLAALVHPRGLQTVVTLPPNASRKLRDIALRYASGCLYVPRGRMTGGAQPFDNVDAFCQTLAAESELPIVVGVGVKDAEDVAAICRTPAKAAAVGSALVEHLTAGGSAGSFVRRLVAG